MGARCSEATYQSATKQLHSGWRFDAMAHSARAENFVVEEVEGGSGPGAAASAS